MAVNKRFGFSLIEVLIAVVVLSVGMLAIAALQGNIARSASEARARSVALNLAEERFETYRAFRTRDDYQAIVDIEGEEIEAAGSGATFTRSTQVTRFAFDPGSGDFVSISLDDPPASREYKLVEVTVDWVTSDGREASVTLNNIISSTTPADSAQAMRRRTGSSSGPQVRIRRPTDASIIPIGVGPDQAAASSNPQPEVSRSGGTTLTQFNVQTYAGVDLDNPLLQRRIDNAIINCSCEFGTLAANEVAYEPTYWSGLRYNSPRPVTGKPIGRPTDRFQQQQQRFERNLCTVCCRDHHETSGVERDDQRIVKLDVWRPANDLVSLNGNHNHYGRAKGDVGDVEFKRDCPDGGTGEPPCNSPTLPSSRHYDEVCRLVRVDGIFHVAPDMRLENVAMLPFGDPEDGGNAFPPGVADGYAEFVRDYVEKAWAGRAGWTGWQFIPNLAEAGSALADQLAAVTGSDEPIAVSSRDARLPAAYDMALRGLYIDYISEETRDLLEKMKACEDSETAECGFYNQLQPLQVIPFSAINLTNLARWYSNPKGIVDVENTPIGSTVPRGRVEAAADGETLVVAESRRGNSGLLDTNDPVHATDPDDSFSRLDGAQLFESLAEPLPRFNIRIVAPAEAALFPLPAVVVGVEETRGCRFISADTRQCVLPAGGAGLTLRFEEFNAEICPEGSTRSPEGECLIDADDETFGDPVDPVTIYFRIPENGLQGGTDLGWARAVPACSGDGLDQVLRWSVAGDLDNNLQDQTITVTFEEGEHTPCL